MTLTTIAISTIGLYLLFRVTKYFTNKTEKQNQENHKKFSKNIRDNWDLIKIKSSDCEIIKFDELVDENTIEKKDENFLEWINKDPHRQNMVNEKRSKLVCNIFEKNKVDRQFVKVIQIDNTVLEFKVRIQDYINVYIPRDFESDEYYIDLDFLDKPIE